MLSKKFISSSQIQVIPTYNGSSCDTINLQSINQPNSLGVSLTSTIGNKCSGGNNLGLIIGISVGIPVLTVIILAIVLKMIGKKEEQDAKRIVKEREMNFLESKAN